MSIKSQGKPRKYRFKLPERHDIFSYLKNSDGTHTLDGIANGLAVESGAPQREFFKRIRAMQCAGQIVCNKLGVYDVADSDTLFQGVVMGHADGYGFLRVENVAHDMYLPPSEMRSLLHGDRVTARLGSLDKRERKVANVVEVLQRANQHIVGRYSKREDGIFVVPRDKRIHRQILITKSSGISAKNGQYVEVYIDQQPCPSSQPIGHVVHVFEKDSEQGIAVNLAIRSRDIPDVWSPEVLQEVEHFSDHIDAEAIKDREDIRHLPFITIDGADAKDFDDAIYCEPKDDGWRLLVAIADVSHYVEVDTALDTEAKERGNSVYFPRYVVPMLPEVLSNGLCSLKPRLDRLCMICEMDIDAHGGVTSSRFFEGVIESMARVIYSDFMAVLGGDDSALLKKYGALLPQFNDLQRLSILLNQQRQKNGVLDFSLAEAGFRFDQSGQVTEIYALQRNDAHRLVEELMLVANVAAAQLLLNNAATATLYRVHESPAKEKLDALHKFLASLGLQLESGKDPTTLAYASLINKTEQCDEAYLIQLMLLRSMKLAHYSEKNKGHFGLGFPVYTHFTSPIRRYADLMVHRAIRRIIRSKEKCHSVPSVDYMRELADHVSTTGRRADEAGRDVVQFYKCEFMQDKVGNCYTGLVCGVVDFGLFVKLDDIYVEGLIHISTLPTDYYHFDFAKHCLRGEHRGIKFRLGDKIKVKVITVSLDKQEINFELVK